MSRKTAGYLVGAAAFSVCISGIFFNKGIVTFSSGLLAIIAVFLLENIKE